MFKFWCAQIACLLDEPRSIVFIGLWLLDGMDELQQDQHKYEEHCLAKLINAKIVQ